MFGNQRLGKRFAWRDRRSAGIRMTILLDEHIPYALARSFPDDWDIRRTQRMRWQGKEHGGHLRRAAGRRFDALITVDGNMRHGQDPNTPLPVVVLRTPQPLSAGPASARAASNRLAQEGAVPDISRHREKQAP